MSTLKITEALKEAGVEAKEVEVVKNSVKIVGYQLETGTNVRPVIYYTPGENIESFVNKAKEVLEREQPEFDFEEIISKESMLTKSYLCVQRFNDEEDNLVKRSYLNLDLFIRLEVKSTELGEASIKVTKDMLKMVGLTEDEIFETAKSNSLKRSTITSMAEALGMPEEITEEIPIYVGSYENKAHGAGILALPEVLKDFCESRRFEDEEIYILPSSTEEVIILVQQTDDVYSLADMVNEVNNQQVEEILRLDPVCYRYDYRRNSIEMAAVYAPEKEV